MNERWDLEPIYKGFEDPAFAEDLAKLADTAAQLQQFASGLPSVQPLPGLHRGLELQEQLITLAMKLEGYASLRQAADTRDTKAGSALGQILSIWSGAAAPNAAFDSWAAALPELESLIETDPILKEYEYLLKNLKKSSIHLLPGAAEETMAKMKLSGGNAWGELQQTLTSTVCVNYRGQTIGLSAVRALAEDADPQVRRDAYDAELACYPAIADPTAYALNSIKLETLNECALRGYADPLTRTLEGAHMERATLDAMLEAMKEYMPKFRQYLKVKGRALGHENGLPWYDLFAPMGSSEDGFTPESTRDYLVNIFSGFDTGLADMIAEAFDNAWIDFYPRSGKAGGAFCAGMECIGQSRILTNFTGTLGDVVTLAHELGHAFHNTCIREHRPLNHDYSMPVAETASTFNECVVLNHAIAHAQTDAQRLALVESDLQGTTQIICDIYSRFLFEAEVFRRRPQEFLDADTLCAIMLEAQQNSYGDGLDPAFRHPYMWVCKSHYYGPTFYNFPYAFGGLFARGLYAACRREGADFVPCYRRLLKATTVATAEDTAKIAGIDLTDVDFWRSALQTVADRIDLFCELASREYGLN